MSTFLFISQSVVSQDIFGFSSKKDSKNFPELDQDMKTLKAFEDFYNKGLEQAQRLTMNTKPKDNLYWHIDSKAKLIGQAYDTLKSDWTIYEGLVKQYSSHAKGNPNMVKRFGAQQQKTGNIMATLRNSKEPILTRLLEILKHNIEFLEYKINVTVKNNDLSTLKNDIYLQTAQESADAVMSAFTSCNNCTSKHSQALSTRYDTTVKKIEQLLEKDAINRLNDFKPRSSNWYDKNDKDELINLMRKAYKRKYPKDKILDIRIITEWKSWENSTKLEDNGSDYKVKRENYSIINIGVLVEMSNKIGMFYPSLIKKDHQANDKLSVYPRSSFTFGNTKFLIENIGN